MKILVLGTGGMAANHVRHFAEIEGVEIVGGVDVDPDRVKIFTDAYGIARKFTSLEAALDWGEFDAIANVTPDAAHHPTTIAALDAGKHVFCEKPLATNYPDALEMADMAERTGCIGMVNLSYRNVPELQKARQIVQSGELGNIRHFEASYLQSWLVSKAWGDWRTESKWLWRLSTRHGSNGVLGDIGVHILDFASYAAGSDIAQIWSQLANYEKAPSNHIGEYLLDANDSFAMTATLANGALGVIHASRWATGHMNELRLRLYGDAGAIELIHRHNGTSLRACLGEDIEGGAWVDVTADRVPTNYDRFVTAFRTGETLEPSFRHAAQLQRLLDIATQQNTLGHPQHRLSHA